MEKLFNPNENIEYNSMISIGYHRQIDYLKTTTPKKINKWVR